VEAAPLALAGCTSGYALRSINRWKDHAASNVVEVSNFFLMILITGVLALIPLLLTLILVF
jgi:hypothetical protein